MARKNKQNKITNKYDLCIHPELMGVDLESVFLPGPLKENFNTYCSIFRIGPDNFNSYPGLKTHSLNKRKLQGYNALDIEWNGNPDAFKLVYKMPEYHKSNTIRLISFSSHNEAYDSAEERELVLRRKGSKKLPRKSKTKRRPSRPS